MISEEYKTQLVELNSKNKFKGKNQWYDEFKNFIANETLPNSIIDFGCAHGNFIDKLKNDFKNIKIIDGYDPGVEEFQKKPSMKYDWLVSTDVIEHIEPDFLDETLEYIDSLFIKKAWIIIACYPAKKILNDGRNAHLIVEKPQWWLDKVKRSMINSKIIEHSIIIKNPNIDIKNKKDGLVLIPANEQIELKLILEKNGQS